MQALHATAAKAVRDLLATQPLSAAKVDFAWRLAAGATLARAVTTTWTTDGRLIVRVPSETWRREMLRARPVILGRLSELLGPDAVTRLLVTL